MLNARQLIARRHTQRRVFAERDATRLHGNERSSWVEPSRDPSRYSTRSMHPVPSAVLRHRDIPYHSLLAAPPVPRLPQTTLPDALTTRPRWAGTRSASLLLGMGLLASVAQAQSADPSRRGYRAEWADVDHDIMLSLPYFGDAEHVCDRLANSTLIAGVGGITCAVTHDESLPTLDVGVDRFVVPVLARNLERTAYRGGARFGSVISSKAVQDCVAQIRSSDPTQAMPNMSDRCFTATQNDFLTALEVHALIGRELTQRKLGFGDRRVIADIVQKYLGTFTGPYYWWEDRAGDAASTPQRHFWYLSVPQHRIWTAVLNEALALHGAVQRRAPEEAVRSAARAGLMPHVTPGPAVHHPGTHPWQFRWWHGAAPVALLLLGAGWWRSRRRGLRVSPRPLASPPLHEGTRRIESIASPEATADHGGLTIPDQSDYQRVYTVGGPGAERADLVLSPGPFRDEGVSLGGTHATLTVTRAHAGEPPLLTLQVIPPHRVTIIRPPQVPSEKTSVFPCQPEHTYPLHDADVLIFGRVWYRLHLGATQGPTRAIFQPLSPEERLALAVDDQVLNGMYPMTVAVAEEAPPAAVRAASEVVAYAAVPRDIPHVGQVAAAASARDSSDPIIQQLRSGGELSINEATSEAEEVRHFYAREQFLPAWQEPLRYADGRVVGSGRPSAAPQAFIRLYLQARRQHLGQYPWGHIDTATAQSTLWQTLQLLLQTNTAVYHFIGRASAAQQLLRQIDLLTAQLQFLYPALTTRFHRLRETTYPGEAHLFHVASRLLDSARTAGRAAQQPVEPLLSHGPLLGAAPHDLVPVHMERESHRMMHPLGVSRRELKDLLADFEEHRADVVGLATALERFVTEASPDPHRDPELTQPMRGNGSHTDLQGPPFWWQKQ